MQATHCACAGRAKRLLPHLAWSAIVGGACIGSCVEFVPTTVLMRILWQLGSDAGRSKLLL